MGKIFVVLLMLFVPLASGAEEAKMIGFIKTCAWGTLMGSGGGVVAMAFEEEPGKHTNLIARGASLGLYAGIAVGLLALNESSQSQEANEASWSWMPLLHAGEIQGGLVLSPVYRF